MRRHCRAWLLTAACTVLWTDYFPVAAPQAQLYQEMKVEMCRYGDKGAHYIYVRARLFRDVQTLNGLEKHEVSDWQNIETKRIECPEK